MSFSILFSLSSGILATEFPFLFFVVDMIVLIEESEFEMSGKNLKVYKDKGIVSFISWRSLMKATCVWRTNILAKGMLRLLFTKLEKCADKHEKSLQTTSVYWTQ